MYIGDNANVRCEQCGDESRVDNWSIQCGGEKDVILMSCTATKKLDLSEVISIAGQIVSFTGMSWLKNYLEHLGEF
ncbi:hypothetical protein DD829_13915 [Chryseobacterium sp. HMWF035]|nr:hypothetical protein [Chryseobacterium sp. HMWF001]PTT76553.1 hypothetical protein DBR25_05570 [Chryseobacterium sp. HMWF001]PVV55562.1 hypothetical protein DD829_13915 [Chryseobacterium sp. HMWF035]